MNIGVFTSFDDNFKSVGDITYPVLESYCVKNNYYPHLINKRISDRFPVWDKIKILQDNLEKFDYVMYLDADTLITNHTIKIENIIGDSNKCLFISKDCNNYNSGVFILKNTSWSKNFLDKVWNIDQNHPIYNWCCNWGTTQAEQLAMIAILSEDRYSEKFTEVLPQSSLNSYLYNLYDRPDTTDGHWKKGGFILHLPALSQERRVEIFMEKLGEIIYD